MKKTRLRFYVYGLPTGGTTVAIIRLANVLIRKYDVVIFSAWEPEKEKIYQQLDRRVNIETFKPIVAENKRYPFGVRAIRWQWLNFLDKKVLYSRFLFRMLYKAILKPVDWEIGFTETEDVLRLLSWSPVNNKNKKLVVHTDFYQNTEMSCVVDSIQQTIANVAGETITVSHYIENEIHKHIPDANIKTCYNLIDFDFIIKKSNEYEISRIDRTPHIICVGRFSPVKGHLRLLESHMKLLGNGHHHHLFLIGHGGAHEQIVKDFIQKNKLDETVHLTGYQDNPYPYFKICDGLIQASFSEGLPTTLIEGLTFHLPMAATDVGGTKEILGFNNEFGWVTENSTAGVLEALQKLVADVAWRDSTRSNNVETQKQKFYDPQKWVELFSEGGIKLND